MHERGPHPRHDPERFDARLPLSKTHDYPFAYRGYYDPGGVMRVRIFAGEERPPLILARQLPGTASTAVSNLIEYLAAEIAARHFPDRLEELEEPPFLWVEEMRRREPAITAAPRFLAATFASYTPRIVQLGAFERVRLGRPTVRPIPEEALARLIGKRDVAGLS